MDMRSHFTRSMVGWPRAAFLGEQRDCRRNPVLVELLAETVRLGTAWVRLGPGQVCSPTAPDSVHDHRLPRARRLDR
ncbi:MAG TPA: hypothetical protein VJQ57_04165 [Acidimicrobiia bacterium]|nr:hypothetical protein [Acidimicrobiia bacterium]